MTKPIKGIVESLCINGIPTDRIIFDFGGPRGDVHSGLTRPLSGHDGRYRATSDLRKGDEVANTRQWTALSLEENSEVEERLGVSIPPGILLENMIISGFPRFSKTTPTSRLVFPLRLEESYNQAILKIHEENTPCDGVGKRVAAHHNDLKLNAAYVKAALDRRGQMGTVFSPGVVCVGDPVLLFPPVRWTPE